MTEKEETRLEKYELISKAMLACLFVMK